MRIAFVTDDYTPYVSGVINFINSNRRYLERHGHEVWVFAFGGPRAISPDEHVVLSPGVKVLGTDGFRLGTRLTRRVHALIATMDVVHVDDPFWSGRLALSVCRHHGVPVVFTNHTRVDLYPDYFLKMFPSGSLDEALASYMRRFCRKVDVVISPSRRVAQVLRELGVDVKIDIVRNGIDIDPFLALPRPHSAEVAPPAVSAGTASVREGVVMAYSGRLSLEKNLSLLLLAFAQVASRLPEARLTLIGDGPFRHELEAVAAEAGVSERVHFTGMVPYANMAARLAPCDLWVTASTTEVEPLTVIEAMAAGLPIVGPDAPGIADIVQDGVTGLLVRPDDVATLAEGMVRLGSDAPLRARMGAAARDASKDYSIEVTGGEMLAIYEEVARVGRSRRVGSQTGEA